MKLFVDTDSDTRLARRVPRDINERGRDLDQVLNQYMTFVKPAFEEFCSPVSISSCFQEFPVTSIFIDLLRRGRELTYFIFTQLHLKLTIIT